jgi:hypothetical protein
MIVPVGVIIAGVTTVVGVVVLRPAHWCTILVSVIFDGSLMHPWCRQVIALLA